MAHNLLIGEQKVRQTFQIGKIVEPLFRVIFQIYLIAWHIQTTILK
jgi:hypothetical protein